MFIHLYISILLRKKQYFCQTWCHILSVKVSDKCGFELFLSDMVSYTGSQGVRQMRFWAISVRHGVIHWQSRCPTNAILSYFCQTWCHILSVKVF